MAKKTTKASAKKKSSTKKATTKAKTKTKKTPTKKATTKKASTKAKSAKQEPAVTDDADSKEQPNVDRRGEDRRQKDLPVATNRRKVQRRRQIDPTTCERDYSQDEIEFMDAMDAYKRANGRMFPTCSEILEVVRGLGYARPEKTDAAVGVAEVTSPAATSTGEANGVSESAATSEDGQVAVAVATIDSVDESFEDELSFESE